MPKGITKGEKERESGGFVFFLSPSSMVRPLAKKEKEFIQNFAKGKKVDKKPNFMVLLLVKNNRF